MTPVERRIEADVAIIGGGIVGLCIALALLDRGCKVVIAERWIVGAEASGRNGGGVRQQGRALAEIPFAMRSVEAWQRLDARLGGQSGYRQIGHVFVAESDRQMELLALQRQAELAVGLSTEMVDIAALRQLAPGINPRMAGAKFCPTDGAADPGRAPLAVALAAEQAGAILLCHSPVHTIGTTNGRVSHLLAGTTRVEAPLIVNAAGPWSPTIAQMVDVYLPVFPARIPAVLVEPVETITHVYVQTASHDLGLSQRPDGTVRIGAGDSQKDVARFHFRKGFDHATELVRRPKADMLFPRLARAKLVAGWAGIAELTPDRLPILGPVDGPGGFLVASGFSGHGFCLAPFAGEAMAEWIVTATPPVDLAAFRLGRFNREEGPLAPPPGPVSPAHELREVG